MNSDVLKIKAVIVIPNSIMYWRGSIVIIHPSLSVFSLCDSIHIVEKNKKNARGKHPFLRIFRDLYKAVKL